MRFFFILLNCFYLNAEAGTFQENQLDPVVSRLVDWTSFKILLTGAASVAWVRPYDDEIRSKWQGHQKMTEPQAHAGDLIGTGVVGVLALGGQYLWDDNVNHYQSNARGLVYSTVINLTLKNIFNRPRPNDKDRYSFPSGHSMTAFMTATTLTYAYGWKAAAVAYPMAAFVGLSRLSDDLHWGSDVVGGAFVGMLLARASFYSLNQNEMTARANYTFYVYPVIEPGSTGLHFGSSF